MATRATLRVVRDQHPLDPSPQPRQSRLPARIVAALAIVASVVATVITYRNGNVLAYDDALSHMAIARRVMNGYDTGLTQLGNVWLPAPHAAMLLFIWSDALYQSGLAGVFVSMAAYVAGCVYAYKATYLFGRNVAGHQAGVLGGSAAALVFGLNANVLYMQATPMTEVQLYAALLACLYHLQRWVGQRQEHHLTRASGALLLATLIRYEAWPLALTFILTVYIIARREPLGETLSRQQRKRRSQDVTLTFALMAATGIGSWMLYNQFIFGGFLQFKNGDYARADLWAGKDELVAGDLWLTLKTLWYATASTITPSLSILLAVSMVIFMWLARKRASFLPLLVLATTIPAFLAWAVYTGERPLHVMQVHGTMYNVRFGLIMVIPAALLFGLLVSLVSTKAKVIAWAMLLLAPVLLGTTLSAGIVTLQEPQDALRQEAAQRSREVIAGWGPLFRANPGMVLMNSFGNERVAFAVVPSQLHIYEGANEDDAYKHALAKPEDLGVTWIYMRCIKGNEDSVCTVLRDRPQDMMPYSLVYEHPSGILVYRKDSSNR